MKYVAIVLVVFLAAAENLYAQTTPPAAELVPIQWFEAADAPKRDLPTFRRLAPSDPRIAQAERMVDNEAARFIRRVIAAAHRIANPDAAAPLPALPIVFERGGNYAKAGFYELDGAEARLRKDTPYVLLDFDADRLSLTFLHEGGHVADRIVRAGARAEAEWSALLHSTFAVTDRATALGEGFAIHLETVFGHYGSDADRRAWYHRLEPSWSPDSPMRAEFFAPVRDVMTFSQNWARYSAVRDGLPAFEGHVYAGEYLRSQYDPARDRSRLKTGSAMLASEGVIASTLFWIADGHARAAGAEPQKGLEQRGLVEAEARLLHALRQAARASTTRRIDIVDVVTSIGEPASAERRAAIERFVALTRAATAAPESRPIWREMYLGAINLDLQPSRKSVDALEAVRARVVKAALADPGALRTMTGPVLPVRLERVKLRLVALGESFPAEFDLNTLGAAELHLLSTDPVVRTTIESALDRAPFMSYEDFETRTGMTLAALGATPVPLASSTR